MLNHGTVVDQQIALTDALVLAGPEGHQGDVGGPDRTPYGQSDGLMCLLPVAVVRLLFARPPQRGRIAPAELTPIDTRNQ